MARNNSRESFDLSCRSLIWWQSAVGLTGDATTALLLLCRWSESMSCVVGGLLQYSQAVHITLHLHVFTVTFSNLGYSISRLNKRPLHNHNQFIKALSHWTISSSSFLVIIIIITLTIIDDLPWVFTSRTTPPSPESDHHQPSETPSPSLSLSLPSRVCFVSSPVLHICTLKTLQASSIQRACISPTLFLI